MDDEVRPAPRTKARYTGQVRLCTARYRYFSYHLPSIYSTVYISTVQNFGVAMKARL